MERKVVLLGIATLFALVVSVGPSYAGSFKGSITFGGGFEPTGGTGLGDATGIHVLGNVAVVNCALTATCRGEYKPIVGFVAAQFNDFDFPFGGFAPLWTVHFRGLTYSFELRGVDTISQTDDALLLQGYGVATISGKLPSKGLWSFSGDTSGGGIFAFSSTTTVPEPATTTLLVVGILGGVRAYRRRKAF